MINKKLVSDFAEIIGYIDIVLKLDGFDDVKNDYESVKNELLLWIDNYYKNKNFDVITYEKSLEIHNVLQDIRDVKIYDKNLGMEAMITDNIFIRYEVIVKSINEERGR